MRAPWRAFSLDCGATKAMGAGPELRAVGGGALPPIATRVVIGVCDLSGAGVRALLGLSPGDGTQPTTCALELHVGGSIPGSSGDGEGDGDEEGGDGAGSGAKAVGAVFTPGGDPDLAEGTSQILLINLLPGVTLIAANTPLGVDEEASFAAAVYALTAASGCTSVVLVGALKLNVKGEGKIFQAVMNGCQALDAGAAGVRGAAAFEALPGGTAVNDGVIAALMHAMRAAAMPTACLFTHGYRVPKLGGEAEEEAAAAVGRLGAAAAAALGCEYRSKGLAAIKLWHEDTTAPKNTDRMYM